MRLKWHYTCTACGHKNNIIWAMFTLSTFFLRCRQCKSVMRVKNIFYYVAFTFMAFGIVLASYLQDKIENGTFSRDLNPWVLIGLFLGFELVVSLIMCNMATLEPVKLSLKKKDNQEKESEDNHPTDDNEEEHPAQDKHNKGTDDKGAPLPPPPPQL